MLVDNVEYKAGTITVTINDDIELDAKELFDSLDDATLAELIENRISMQRLYLALNADDRRELALEMVTQSDDLDGFLIKHVLDTHGAADLVAAIPQEHLVGVATEVLGFVSPTVGYKDAGIPGSRDVYFNGERVGSTLRLGLTNAAAIADVGTFSCDSEQALDEILYALALVRRIVVKPAAPTEASQADSPAGPIERDADVATAAVNELLTQAHRDGLALAASLAEQGT